jgi:hypothetical protein
MSSVASATDTILASPVISVVLGLIASGIGATVVGVVKVLSRIQSLQAQVALMDKSIAALQHDMDVIKWGAVAGANVIRQQSVIPPVEGS